MRRAYFLLKPGEKRVYNINLPRVPEKWWWYNILLRLNVGEEDYDDESAMPMTKSIMTKVSEKLDWPALCQTVSSVSFFDMVIKFILA